MEHAVIMAGGQGQRLWPLSRKKRPKQIINLFDGQSLLQKCVERIRTLFAPENILVVTNADYVDTVREHLVGIPAENVLAEPVGRNTANAVGLAVVVLARRDPQGVMAVFSADQLIEPPEPLQQGVRCALAFLKNHPQALFTFGIRATFAHTGLGYLKRGEQVDASGVFRVEAFKEKPNKSTAQKYIRSGNYCWNSGIFAWRVDTIIGQLEQFLPHNADRLARIGQAWGTERYLEVLNQEFPQLENISIDYGVMEKAAEVYMCELDCHWMDVGSFAALAETLGQSDADENTRVGRTLGEFLDSRHTIAISADTDHLIATIGVEDLIVVHSPDATLICHRDEADRLRHLLAQLAEKGLDRYT